MGIKYSHLTKENENYYSISGNLSDNVKLIQVELVAPHCNEFLQGTRRDPNNLYL